MQPQVLLQRIKAKQPPAILDVRSGFEFKSGHIPGALHAPSWKILLRLVSLPADKNAELILTCEHGPRAEMAKGLLNLYGYKNVALLHGHMSGWRRAGQPLER